MAFACMRIFLGRNSSVLPKPAGSLVYGLSKEHYSGTSDLESLGLYLDRQQELIGLTPPDLYLIQTGNLLGNRKIGKVKMVPYISIEMLKYVSKSRIAQVKDLFGRFLSLLRLSTSLPEIFEIAPEYVVDENVLSTISHFEIRSLITTQSQMLVLPTVFYHEVSPNRIMFWYSDNSAQIEKSQSKNQKTPDYSYLNQKRINTHYVWTSSWSRLLKSFTHAQILVVGPILFKLLQEPQADLRLLPESIKNILVFDVTPKKSTNSNSLYYSSNMEQFIRDLVEIADDLLPSAVLKLKPKRKYSNNDHSDYLRLVKSLDSRLHVLSPTQDLIALIRDSDMVICVPFTSPAVLAKFMGKPVFYYSPSPQFKLPAEYEGIQVVSGRQDLRRAIESIIK
jgi:polysaccharide biosynthesis PFTS motif protein